MIEHRFLVMSAFQALNAIEARQHFQFDPERCELVLLEPREARSREETARVIELGGWAHQRTVGPPATSVGQWLRRVQNARGLRGQSASLDTLVIGDYATQLMRHAAHGVDGGRVVALDDGSVTMRLAEYRAALVKGGPRPRLQPQVPRGRWQVQEVVARGLGLRTGDLDAITLFTQYDIEPTPPDSLVRNRFEWLRRRLGRVELEEGALFVGTPVVEVGIIEHDTCVTMLRRLREHAGGRLLYRPHPREDRDHVAALVAEVGMEILDLDTIVEVGLVERGRVPGEIVANHSSSLDSLRIIFDDQVSVRSIPLPPAIVNRAWRDFIARSYRELDARLGAPVERLEILSAADAE